MSNKKPDCSPDDLFRSIPPAESFHAFPPTEAFSTDDIAFLTGRNGGPSPSGDLPASLRQTKPLTKPASQPLSQSCLPREPSSVPPPEESYGVVAPLFSGGGSTPSVFRFVTPPHEDPSPEARLNANQRKVLRFLLSARPYIITFAEIAAGTGMPTASARTIMRRLAVLRFLEFRRARDGNLQGVRIAFNTELCGLFFKKNANSTQITHAPASPVSRDARESASPTHRANQKASHKVFL